MAVKRIKNINEGVQFNKKTFLQNCKDVRMRLSDLIDDNYYNNMDDLNDDDIDVIEREINDIIGMCRSILSEFNLLDESKKLSEGTKFNATKFKKNCLIAEKAIDEIVDDNYDNVDDLTDGEATFIKNHFGSIIIRCRKFLDDFNLTESNKKKYSKKLKESKLREFTKSDWNAFAGAEEFDDGSQPLIAEFADGIITLIVSGTGDVDDDNEAIVQLIYLDDDESEGGDGAWYKDFESKKDAIKFALEASTELDYYTAEDVEYDDVENFAYSNKMSSLM